MYHVFVRTFWKIEKVNGATFRIPRLGKKTTLARVATRAEAQEICKGYNATHSPGSKSRKAEFQSE